MSTFGIIIPGRPVDAGFQQVENNKFLITIPNAEAINHVVVFLTGLAQLPPGTASCIYFSMPDPNSPPAWNYLGYISNEKPSSIYRITNIVQSCSRNGIGTVVDQNNQSFNYAQAPVLHVAQIGISVEPIESVIQMVPAIENGASNVNSFSEFINKTVSNLYNYCSSFSRSASDLIGNPFQQGNPSGNTQYVPLSSIQVWYENYTRRLSNDPNFWRTLN